jgi:hypothetical protein
MEIIHYGSNLWGQKVVLGMADQVIPFVFFVTLGFIFLHIVYSFFKSYR